MGKPMRTAFILAAMMSASIAATACGQSPGQDPFVFVAETDENGSRPAPGTFVWYLLPMSIRPTGTSVSGIRLSQINAWRTRQAQDRPAIDVQPWCFANALSDRSFTSSSEVVQANIESSFRDNPEHRFRLRGRFTGENELLALVGHYEECDGETGSFIMLLDDAAAPPRLVHVDDLPYVSGLQYMRLVDGDLTVSTCFECGDVTGYFYDRRRGRFYWESLGD
jgi:hypothetical protein